MKRIYLDHAATTPIHPAVESVMEHAAKQFGNPSSLHQEGRAAKDIIDQAREVISLACGSLFAEVIFTGSGTESCNLAIVGAALANTNPKRDTILFSAAEHHCVLNTQPLLNRLGYKVVLLPVDREGRCQHDEIDRHINDSVLLVSVMHANNETGAIQNMSPILSKANQYGVIAHCDCVQTFTSPTHAIPQAHLISIAAHKINGPKGVGALVIRAGTQVQPLLRGGAQEREIRPGTENLVGIAAFAQATRIRTDAPLDNTECRDAFEAVLQPKGAIVTAKGPRLGSHSHLRFPGISAETVLIKLDRLGIAASSGAACSSGSIEPSHVMLASGYTATEASEALRFSFGLNNTKNQAEDAAQRVASAIAVR